MEKETPRLDMQVLRTGQAVSYGSTALKSLQNINIPKLDLLVREAIQNSTDASLGHDGKMCIVNFQTGTFRPADFNALLGKEAAAALSDRFPRESAQLLEIRDTKTSGLTGPVHAADLDDHDHGNYYKLVFDTGKQQKKDKGGGNWGFGKSVYYLAGIGLVIFYTRIQTEAGYEERLIVSLIENEECVDAQDEKAVILRNIKSYAGRAWWGEGVPDGRGGFKEMLPVSDPERISPILAVLNVNPFGEKETGTAVIIPYVDAQGLLAHIIPADDESQGQGETDERDVFRGDFLSSLSDYLRLSIQRWYAPKIHNRRLENLGVAGENKWLRVSVNHEAISRNLGRLQTGCEMLPFFELVQELYTSALEQNYGQAYQSESFPMIKTETISVQNYFQQGKQTVVGCLAMAKVSRHKLGKLAPYLYIGNFTEGRGASGPILMYAREPGMVIDYEFMTRMAMDASEDGVQESYVFAFFVPRTEEAIRQDFEIAEYAGMRLGTYLRNCESSDHMSWKDPSGMDIVARIRRSCRAHMKKILGAATERPGGTASKLAGSLGRKLLPKKGYGIRKQRRGGSGGAGGNGRSLGKARFYCTLSGARGDEALLDFTLELRQGKTKALLSLMIDSEAGSMSAADWQKDVGLDFPVTISSCHIASVSAADFEQVHDAGVDCTAEVSSVTIGCLDMELRAEEGCNSLTQLEVKTHDIHQPKITGQLRLHCRDRRYRFAFSVV